ncbi:MAG: adenylosuccinate lyase [Acidobacteria bacterium]|nr:MAG: adenylosuccinate lyase [Acidobacteriota bacterium]
MPSTVFDSFYFKDRFGSAAMRDIWNDRATLQRWLDVEVALAEVEAELGIVPRKAAREIKLQARIENLDLRALKRAFDRTWNPVVPLVDGLRRRLSPRSAGYVHWGATSKNIFDTGIAIQVKEAYAVIENNLASVARLLAGLAEEHRDTIMAGRTHGQHALPVTFGFKAAVWLDEILRQQDRLREGKKRVLVGEFGGAVGTLASLGPKGLRIHKELMKRLGLGIATIPVKTAGDRLAEFVIHLGMLSATLGKIAQNIYNLQQTDVDEVTEFTEGKVGSSAMPHKQNPVASGSVVFLGRLLRSNVLPALDYIHAEWEDDHRQGETAWKFVPEACLLIDAQLELTQRVLANLIVKPENMERNLERAGGFVCSEALLMKLAIAVGRDRAHAIVKELSDEARRNEVSFSDAVRAHPIVRKHLRPKEIEDCVNYRAYLGETKTLVKRVLANYRKTLRRKN